MPDKTKFRAALVQMRSRQTVEPNITAATDLIKQAAAAGAHYILTPENTSLMELRTKPLFAAITTENADQSLKHFKHLAKNLKIWLHIGSLAIKLTETKVANRSYLLSPAGTIAAKYDKIHMFDVDLPGGETYRESKNYAPGESAILADLPWGKLGLTICYDLRFPHLYRQLAKAGANMITVPAAFTKQTGEAHWHVLLRARAIETGCFVFAAAQGGLHENERATFGHSMIISPWGEIIAEMGQEPGWISAEIDLNEASAVRQRIPSLQHDRDFQ